MSREKHHEFWGESRKAEVYKTDLGWEVDLTNLKNNEYATRQVHEHSETYAENVADDFGYYGYNEKNRNYVHGLDD